MVGFITAYALTFIVPLPSDNEAKTTGLWRPVFIMPAIYALVQLVLFAFVFRHDTPRFYQLKGKLDNYHKSRARLYYQGEVAPKNRRDEEDPTTSSGNLNTTTANLNQNKTVATVNIQENEENGEEASAPAAVNNYISSEETTNKDSLPKVSWWNQYKKALVVGSLLSIFHQSTGVTAVFFFSNEIFTRGKMFPITENRFTDYLRFSLH